MSTKEIIHRISGRVTAVVTENGTTKITIDSTAAGFVPPKGVDGPLNNFFYQPGGLTDAEVAVLRQAQTDGSGVTVSFTMGQGQRDVVSVTAHTKLTVTNDTNAAVEVFVTFAAANPENTCCGTPATVGDFPFLTEEFALRGKFNLAAGATQEFDPQGRCFSGNIGFYIAPQCPVKGADFNNGKTGTNIAEFTLNPNKGCDEAFDISCVNGVNCYMQMKVEKGLGWAYGPKNTPIETIYNKGLQLNAGNPGVYPVNCTTCTGSENAPCSTLPIGPAQTEPICNIQRSQRGGTVQVTLQTVGPV
jgi:hypothetical protein